MSRTTITAICNNPQITNQNIANILSGSKYKLINENGENVWKCGIGFLTAIKYIKIDFADNNTIQISGWIRPAGGKEQDLNGVIAAVPKKQVMNTIQKIQEVIV